MNQYQVKYISHNDRIAVCYLHAGSLEEAEESARILQGCKQLISIRVWSKEQEDSE